MEDNRSSGSTDQVSWNLSSMLIKHIALLLQRSSNQYARGDYIACFISLKEIRFLIYADLTGPEVEVLRILEGKINEQANKSIKVTPRGFSQMAKEDYTKIMSSTNKDLTEYREEIMELLGDKGYLIAKKKDSGRMF